MKNKKAYFYGFVDPTTILFKTSSTNPIDEIQNLIFLKMYQIQGMGTEYSEDGDYIYECRMRDQSIQKFKPVQIGGKIKNLWRVERVK